MGRIRLHASRAISDQFRTNFFDSLFALTPDRFALGDTSDYLVVEFIELQQKIDGQSAPGCERGVYWLSLDQVAQFFPIKADDAWTFESDADKANVSFSAAMFEPQWLDWSRNQTVNQAYINGMTLCRTLGLTYDSERVQSEKTMLRGLAMDSLYPVVDGLGADDFQKNFFLSVESLFDLVRGDSDKGSLFVSCPVEWVCHRSNVNLLEEDPTLGDLAQRELEMYWSVKFDPALSESEGITRLFDALKAKVPDFFPGSWTPALITLYVRYSHLIRYGSVKPEEIVAAINALRRPGDQSSAQLLAFLLGVALGANKVHALERLLHPERFKIAKSFSDQIVESAKINGV